MYIHQRKDWPNFTWDADKISPLLGAVRHNQGKILGQMQALGFKLQEETMLKALTLDVVKTSQIEGEQLNPEQVRSSIARRLGIEIAGAVPAERSVEGIVEMLLDATQSYAKPLTAERLFDWHAALFPTGRSGMYKINVGAWRADVMQVTSGPMGKEIIHFEAPPAIKVPAEMQQFLDWIETDQGIDPVIKAAIAHLWFVTIHPFDDGNGRIARAIADLQLARADQSPQRFYSMSAQIQAERNKYYDILENTQKGELDITPWLEWFLDCLMHSMAQTDEVVSKTLIRAKFWETHRETQLNVRQQKILHLLLDDFFGVLNVSKYAKINKTSTDTALRDIQDLMQKDILEQEGKGRSTSYRLK
ncbi:Fic family protein [Flavobacterium limnosediminis JC2902]|uniref:Fic family protein n=1 Tax=Flavobacterium limnosediminis JC2902 TaxID=1341181 RepID=V6SP95_9FLAO|nr:Fic family protein [Flavobacterium limnosediminis]ESU28528.1 Fic family protein [Flavobacterium limnosediminis JC2902]